MRRLAAAVVLALAVPAATAAQEGSAPTVTEIRVTFAAPVTTYEAVLSDPDGDPLTVTWTKSDERPCGDFTFDGAVARWSHPHPPCPSEDVHPGTITVQVSDGQWSTSAAYTNGSAEGVVTFTTTPAVPLAPATTTASTGAATTGATTSTTASTTTTVAAAATDQDDDGSSLAPIAIGALVASLLGGGLWWWLRLRVRRRTPWRDDRFEALAEHELDVLTGFDMTLVRDALARSKGSGLSVEDRIALFLSELLAGMDAEIEERTANLDDLVNDAASTSNRAEHAARIDTAGVSLHRLTEQRGQLFDINRQVIARLEETSRAPIQSQR